jgi:predicted nicotinamide N-methyase
VSAAAEFITGHTAPIAPPLIPEIVLHLSRDEPVGLWEQVEREVGRGDLPPPFWAYPWAGGIALARYLLDHPDEVAGRVVLDVAAGSGLVAIAAALAGAARVVASDIDPLAVAAIGLNAAANGVCVTVARGDLLAGDAGGAVLAGGAVVAGGAVLAGGSVLAGATVLACGGVRGGDGRPAAEAGLAGGNSQQAGVVLVGDAFYERRMAHRMLAFLDRARAGGARVLVGDPGRTYLPPDRLRAVASYAVPVWAGLEDEDVKQTTVWEPA